MMVGVGVQVRSMLPQIERRWVQGRLTVVMGTGECGMVVASVGGPQGAWSVLAVRAMPPMVGGGWPQVDHAPSNQKVVSAGPVGSRHGSYQCVWYGGGQCWWPPERMVSVGSQGNAINGWW